MKLEIKKEIVTPNSTNTDPLLYNLTIKGVGNLQECEFIINRLAEQASVEPEVMQKIAEIPENLKVRFMIVNHKTNSISCHWLEPSHEGQIIGNDEMQIENIRFELE